MLEGEKDVFEKIYPACSIIFDVGARYDIDYIEISQGNNIQYHLFEINPRFFNKLVKNTCDYRNKEDIILNNFGIAERDGSSFYYQDSQSILRDTTAVQNSTARSTKRLPLRSLESYCNEKGIDKINFLKTDIEEYDFFALQGLGSRIRTVDFIQFELGLGAPYLDRRVEARDYFSLLGDNFNLYLVKDEKNPIWYSGFTSANLIKVGDQFLQSTLSAGTFGIGYNVLAANKNIDINTLGLVIESFNQESYERVIQSFIK